MSTEVGVGGNRGCTEFWCPVFNIHEKWNCEGSVWSPDVMVLARGFGRRHAHFSPSVEFGSGLKLGFHNRLSQLYHLCLEVLQMQFKWPTLLLKVSTTRAVVMKQENPGIAYDCDQDYRGFSALTNTKSSEIQHVKTMSASEAVVHVALLPSAGMGHLNPCLRLAAVFLRHGCKVTLITPRPTVSIAESNIISRFCSFFPHQVTQIDFNLIPLDPTTVAPNIDPFYLQFQTIRHSIHLLYPILSSLTTPLSAFIYNVALISAAVTISEKLFCPSYMYFPTAARMFSFTAYVSVLADSDPAAQPHPSTFIGDAVQIPGFTSPIPRSSVPTAFLLQGSNSFQRMIMEDSRKLTKLDGVFINSFEELEGEALAALNEGKVVRGLPPVYGIGPLMACEFENVDQGQKGGMSWVLEWLDEQAEGSVVYVSLGSRTETRKEQIKDTALGLIECGYGFLWVVKLKRVDREEEEDLEDVLGSELMSKVREKGVVVKEFVDQIKIRGTLQWGVRESWRVELNK
ncbi:hypothetical protein ACSQ67_009176 [Phaseolus vulgaris]